MSERPHKKNHMPLGTPPRKPRVLRPGRNRLAKGYDAYRNVWVRALPTEQETQK